MCAAWPVAATAPLPASQIGASTTATTALASASSVPRPAAAPEIWQQREWTWEHERAAVGGQQIDEAPDVAVPQRLERGLGLQLVVGEGHGLEPHPGQEERSAAGHQRGQEEPKRAWAHGL